jgi:hypothetical protein
LSFFFFNNERHLIIFVIYLYYWFLTQTLFFCYKHYGRLIISIFDVVHASIALFIQNILLTTVEFWIIYICTKYDFLLIKIYIYIYQYDWKIDKAYIGSFFTRSFYEEVPNTLWKFKTTFFSHSLITITLKLL